MTQPTEAATGTAIASEALAGAPERGARTSAVSAEIAQARTAQAAAVQAPAFQTAAFQTAAFQAEPLPVAASATRLQTHTSAFGMAAGVRNTPPRIATRPVPASAGAFSFWAGSPRPSHRPGRVSAGY